MFISLNIYPGNLIFWHLLNVFDKYFKIIAHTTQFTNIGWIYLNHGSGVGMLNYGGSYVTLVSPDGNDFTIIIETMVYIEIQWK